MHAGLGLPSGPRSQDLRLHSYSSFLGTTVSEYRDRWQSSLPRSGPAFHVRHFDCHHHRPDNPYSTDPAGLGDASTSKAESQDDNLARGWRCCNHSDSRQSLPKRPIYAFKKYVSSSLGQVSCFCTCICLERFWMQSDHFNRCFRRLCHGNSHNDTRTIYWFLLCLSPVGEVLPR